MCDLSWLGIHMAKDRPCRICGCFGAHVHVAEEAERIRRETAEQLETMVANRAHHRRYKEGAG